MTDLTRDALLAPRILAVDLPDGRIYLRALSAGYAVGLRGRTLGDADIFDMIAHSVCDAKGIPILTAADVAEMPLSSLQSILDQILAFNALAPNAAAEALKKTPA